MTIINKTKIPDGNNVKIPNAKVNFGRDGVYYNIIQYPDNGKKWVMAIAIAVGIHALPLLIAAYWINPMITPPPQEPAIFIDMPAAATPAPPKSQESPSQEQVKPTPEKIEKPEQKPQTQEKQTVSHQVKKQAINPPIANSPVVNPAVSIPVETPQTNNPINKQEVANNPPPVQNPSPAPAATSQTRADNPQSQISWQGLLLDRLNKFQKYPPSAMSRNQQGVPYVRINMDRNGKVLSTKLERSSGFPLLDAEAVNLPKRASPLPKPPQDVHGNNISIIVPIEFFFK